MNAWMRLRNEDDVPSPALLIYHERVVENIRRTVALAGGVERLRPHVKTHKLAPIIALELAQGIRKFKVATIAEAEMCAAAGAPDVMLAYQPVGPNVRRIVELAQKFSRTGFSCLVDNSATVLALGAAATAAGRSLDVFLDLDIGYLRTGIAPGPEAVALSQMIACTPGLHSAGLHAYHGLLRTPDREKRVRDTNAAFEPVWTLRDELLAAGLPVPVVVAGGTSSFPILGGRDGVEVGPGATVLWDTFYTEFCPDLDFLHAAVLLTRVISRPGSNRLCLDLGCKAIASEMPLGTPRVRLAGLEDATLVMQNEEHLVVETPRAREYPIGTAIYGIPRHICPTVALYDEVFVVRDERAVETWPVIARARRITV
ncbi:MAG: D-TA family PLP-dependent enzyme [Opitutaceae bacterium]|nr:D-TA family PLP-dependent enzyme [Opitutaceae bacterium]